jgi:steroid delta-isomerase-like uncharacterized protein
MGQAREIMDRATDAAMAKDTEALQRLYAADAVAETPDQGTLRGREAVMGWFDGFLTAFPDFGYESVHKHESGDSAIDEGYVVGTNTGPLPGPTGETPATGKSVRLRGCDIATVRDGAITSHRFYFDQIEFLAQLGLAPQE